jgi:hypothetical protein
MMSRFSIRTPLKFITGFMLIGIIYPLGIQAQKVLQIEKYGRTKTTKFYIGDEVTFSLKDQPKQYYTRDILELYPEAGTIQFAGGAVALDQIAAIRFKGSNNWAKKLSNTLLIFSGAWTLYSLLDVLINSRKPADFQYQVGGAAWGLTGVFRWLIPEKVVHLGERQRLRILDLTFYPDKQVP